MSQTFLIALMLGLTVSAHAADKPATGPAPGWPTTLETLKAKGFEPFATTLRGKDCRFVVIPDVSLKGEAVRRLRQMRLHPPGSSRYSFLTCESGIPSL